MSAGLSVLENVQVAGIAAVTEGVLLQPTLYWKNAAAQKLPFTLDPRLLYRGTAASVLNETQMMVMQFAFTRMFQRLWGQSAGQASAAQLLVTATAGGCASAFLSAPIELVMIQQQRFGRSFPHTLASVVRTHGLGSAGLMRGLGPTVARDGVYVNGLLGITPVVQRLLLKRGASRNSASVGGSLVGGAICSLASHPSDMVKTCMQGDLTQTRYGTALQTLRVLWADGGLRRIFKGGVAKLVNVTATIYIANECVNRVPALLFSDALSQHQRIP